MFTQLTIDDLRIYNRAITQSEIELLYRENCYGYVSTFSIPTLAETINDTLLIPVNVSIPSCKSYSSAQINFSDYQTGLDFLGVDTSGTLAGAAGWQIQTNETSSLLLTA